MGKTILLSSGTLTTETNIGIAWPGELLYKGSPSIFDDEIKRFS